jgi:putative Holliday junction resolvase
MALLTDATHKPATQERSPERVVLGVDYGTVRIGLALGFLDTGLVIQLPVLPNPGDEAGAVASLALLVGERAPECVVLGNPVMPVSGDDSAMSKVVARIADRLRDATGVEVVLQDERCSSVEAEETLKEAGLRWWQYAKGHVDTLAAMAIVRRYFAAAYPELALLREEEPAEPPPAAESRRDRRKRARKKRR